MKGVALLDVVLWCHVQRGPGVYSRNVRQTACMSIVTLACRLLLWKMCMEVGVKLAYDSGRHQTPPFHNFVPTGDFSYSTTTHVSLW